eukprot:CAMPEP_0173227422 /NCGR_PEP_ID=MMETSP1142-20121109/5955_1 /TAXON_ID=483371 /ORGANISM="non described non described, Strain CCMP2298" /LENGTH=173 /DNA_ID=CAMNT_0014155937 /DNA_START=438 /DNA_END=958 /DNA_ORIENTATION=+
MVIFQCLGLRISQKTEMMASKSVTDSNGPDRALVHAAGHVVIALEPVVVSGLAYGLYTTWQPFGMMSLPLTNSQRVQPLLQDRLRQVVISLCSSDEEDSDSDDGGEPAHQRRRIMDPHGDASSTRAQYPRPRQYNGNRSRQYKRVHDYWDSTWGKMLRSNQQWLAITSLAAAK